MRYEALVAAGALQGGDPAQMAAADALQRLHDSLTSQQQPPLQRGLASRGAAAAPPHGVYLHGGVGRGKTALMDLFCTGLPAGVTRHRAHSHAWMLALHARLHATPRHRADPLAAVAADIAAQARVLCLDELEITDVADAVLLRRLYPALRKHGMVLVTTSNCAPEELYRGGLNRRELFAPFVADLRASCAVVSLDGGADYRTAATAAPLLYLTPLGVAAQAHMQRAWAALTGGAAAAAVAVPVPGAGRAVTAPAAHGRVCRFTFAELCGATLSAADYLALSGAFDAFLLTDVPATRSDDELRRFVNLVDVLYDTRRLLLLSAEAPLQALFAREAAAAPAAPLAASQLGLTQSGSALSGVSVSGAGGSSGRSTTMVGGVEWSATGRLGASLAHLGAGGGSFARAAAPRAASRLAEMTGRAWAASWAERHAAPRSWLALMGEGAM